MAEEKAKPVPPATPEETAAMKAEADALRLQMDQERADREVERLKLERDRQAAGLDAKKGLIELKKTENLPAEPTATLDVAQKTAFSKAVDSREISNKLDEFTLQIHREDTKINAQNWHKEVTEPAGLKHVYNEFKRLHITDSDPAFYDQMFAVLANGMTNPPNSHLAQPKNAVLFMDPANNYKEIIKLGPTPGGFMGGDLFMKAYQQLLYTQKIMLEQDKGQTGTGMKQEKMDKDELGLASGATDFLKDNIHTFKKAIRDRDYATAGMYAVGIYALYKSYQRLAGGNDSVKKWLTYGAAAYVGHHFLKNAGYDILKMTGLKDQDQDIKGTPMEVMAKILSKNKQLKEDTKDLDYEVVLRMSDAPLKSLDDLREQSNTGGVKFIDPAEFPGMFPPEVLASRPTRLPIDTDLKDSDGMNNDKLSSNEREYMRLGQQIYKVAVAMRGVYDETLKKNKNQEQYFNVDYRVALGDGTRDLGKVRHLMGALHGYAKRAPGEAMFGMANLDKIKGGLKEAFKGHPDSGISVEKKIADGQFEGKIMDMPVIFVMSENGESYTTYLKSSFGGTEVPGDDSIADIPVAAGGPREMAVNTVLTVINARMAKLIEPISGPAVGYSPPRYLRGKWEAEVTLPGMADFDIQATPMKVFVKVSNDGKSVNIVDSTGSVRINLNEDVGNQYPLGVSLAPRITSQPEFHALLIFANVGEFKVIGLDKVNKKVKVNLGKANMPLEFSYVQDPADATKKIFVLDPVAEAALIQDPTFSAELIEHLSQDEEFELNKTMKEFKKMIADTCSESFVIYFFKSIVGGTNKDPLDGINLDVFSGSVPEGFASMIVDSSNTEVMERLRYAVSHASSMEDVEQQRQNVLQDFSVRMRAILENLKKENAELSRKGENWDRDKFMDQVVGRVRMASSISSTYIQSKADFEYMIYGLKLPGLLTQKSDLGGSESHSAAAHLMGVYAYHTARLDDKTLDTLEYPAVPTPGVLPKNDPKLRGHYIKQYMDYVQNTIIAKAQSEGDLSNLPLATAREYWNIDDFDQWKSTEGKYEALNPLDNAPAYAHNEDLHSQMVNGELVYEDTPLDEALKTEYEKVVNALRDEYKDALDYRAIDDYLNKPDEVGGVMTEESKIGILSVYGQTDAAGQPVYISQLWKKTHSINSAAAGKRSLQVKFMEDEMASFVETIFTMPGVGRPLRFFKTSPRWSTTLIMKWPWLRHILPN